VVYRAQQLSLNRIVAVKVIRAERLAREEDVRRLLECKPILACMGQDPRWPTWIRCEERSVDQVSMPFEP